MTSVPPSDLRAAFEAAKPGDVITVAGEPMPVELRDGPDGVTIRSDGQSLSLRLLKVKGLTLEGLGFHKPAGWPGLPYAFEARQCERLTVRDSWSDNTHRSFVCTGCDDLLFERVQAYGTAEGWNLPGCQRVLLKDIAATVAPWRETDHPDCIQWWNGDRPTQDVTIIGAKLRGEGQGVLGPADRVWIEGADIEVGYSRAVSVNRGPVVLNGCEVRQAEDGAKPQVMLQASLRPLLVARKTRVWWQKDGVPYVHEEWGDEALPERPSLPVQFAPPPAPPVDLRPVVRVIVPAGVRLVVEELP